MQKFYEELLANYENPQKKVLATVIESSKSDEDRGLKFILNAGEPAVISRSGADFIQKLDFSKYSSIDEPLLEEIELSDGNKLEVFFQPLVIRPHLYIFGAGHVAQPLAGVSKLAGLR